MSKALHEEILRIAAEIAPTLDLLMQPIALLGNRGSGKTYGGMKIFELAHAAGVQCIVIDPIGKWWGLRLGKNGHGRGLANVYILGGQHADQPLTPESGALVARMLVEQRVHAVLDVSQMRKSERRRFMSDFAEEFHLLKKREAQPSPSILFVEEAHIALPQQPREAADLAMLGAFEDLIREGRNHGIGMVLIDQRPATVNKNALALTEVLIALRTTWKADRDVYAGWIVQKDSDKSKIDALNKALPFFKNGRGFFYAPIADLFAEIQILPRTTFDSSATARVGVHAKPIGKLTPVDLSKLGDAMAEVKAEVAARDPVALKRRIVELERQLAAKPGKAPVVKVGRVKPVPVVKPEFVARIEKAQTALMEALGAWGQKATADLERAFRPLAASLKRYPPNADALAAPLPRGAAGVQLGHSPGVCSVAAVRAPPPMPPAARAAPPPPVARAAGAVEGEPRGLSGGERTVLTVIAQSSNGATPEHVTVVSGYKKSYRDLTLQRLKRAGFIVREGDRSVATSSGISALGSGFRELPTGDALRDHWVRELPEGERRIFEAVCSRFPGSVTREEIGEATGYKKSYRDLTIQRLTRRQLVTVTRAEVTASPSLFGRSAA